MRFLTHSFHWSARTGHVLAVGSFFLLAGLAHAASVASDNADNYTQNGATNYYNQGGQANLGTGFGAWSQGNNGQGYYGTFLANGSMDSQINGPTNGNAFDVYAGSGGTFGITRAFTADSTTNSAALSIGQTFSISLDTRGIDNGTANNGATPDAVGYSLGNRFSFGFRGGEGNFYYQDGTARHDTGIGFTFGGVTTALTLTSVDTYSLVVTRLSDNATFDFTGTLAGTAGSGITSATVFDDNAGDNHDLYFNNLSITGTPVPEPATVCGGLLLTGVLAVHLRSRRRSVFTPRAPMM